MVWIKRNLFFALSAAVGLILMLGAGYFLYVGLSESSAAGTDLTTAQGELTGLQGKSPFPSKDNVQMVKDSQQQVRNVLNQFHVTFAPIPAPPKLTEPEFKDLLDKTILQLQSQATNYGVNLTPGYEFSFSGISAKLNFPTNDIQNWAMQLQQIKSLCNVIYQAKVNSLESIRRPPLNSETNLVTGTGGDFLATTSVTNDTMVHTPYEIVFRAYSPEIAGVLNGFLHSTNNFIIKNIDVAPTTSLAAPTGLDAPTGFMRGGIGGAGYGNRALTPRLPVPTVAAPPTALDGPQGPEIIAQENLSRVVMVVEVINPKAP